MRTFTVASVITIICLLVSMGLEDKHAYSVSAGAPEGRTGSPGDGATCMDQCHGANPGTPNGNEAVALTGLPVGGYVPGTTYDLTLSATGSSNDVFGFQISPQDWSGNMLGSWIMGTSGLVQVINTKWLTHTYAGNSGSGGEHSWDFQWEAPSLGVGDVHLYYSVLFADGMNAHLGDVMLQDSVMLTENTSVSIEENEEKVSYSVNYFNNELRLNNHAKGLVNVRLLNLEGREILASSFATEQHRIDLSTIKASGVYILVMQGADFQYAERIAVLR